MTNVSHPAGSLSFGELSVKDGNSCKAKGNEVA
jgi:hypothetical protein